MTRLIDADELKKCAIPCTIHNGALTDLCVPLYQIDTAPTVKLKRTQGKWIKDYTHEEHGGASIVCSICSYSIPNKSNFCPNCGADMRKGD